MLVKETIKQGFIDACMAVMNDKNISMEEALEKVAEGYARTVIDAIKSATITAPNGACTIQ